MERPAILLFFRRLFRRKLVLVASAVLQLFNPGYADVGLRDFGLAVGAYALGRLAQLYDRRPYGSHGHEDRMQGANWKP